MERTWETCIAFHGHPCPVLATGYRVSKEAMRILELDNLHQNKVACVAESCGCAVDAMQIMLNCTLAKGNMIIRDKGKQVYTIVRNDTGKGVRLTLKKHLHLAWPDPEKWPEDTSGWPVLQDHIINDPIEDTFEVELLEDAHILIPCVGRMFQYVECEMCGDLVAEHAIKMWHGKMVCIDCNTPYEPTLELKRENCHD